MNLTLERKWLSDNCTIGNLYVDGTWQCYILEDKVREIQLTDVSQWKVAGATAIPRGRYRVIKSFSNRFQRITLQAINVPGFTGIRIHPGNKAADTEGCLLPGNSRGDNTVINSKDACERLEARVFPILDRGDEPVWLDVS